MTSRYFDSRDAYAPDSTKSEGYEDAWADWSDAERKRRKEEGPLEVCGRRVFRDRTCWKPKGHEGPCR